MGLVLALKVLAQSEKDDLGGVSLLNEGLGSLKALDRVVQRCVCRIQLEVFNSSNDRRLPASILCIKVDLRHVICCQTSKGVRVISTRLGQHVFPLVNDEVLCLQGLSMMCAMGQLTLNDGCVE